MVSTHWAVIYEDPVDVPFFGGLTLDRGLLGPDDDGVPRQDGCSISIVSEISSLSTNSLDDWYDRTHTLRSVFIPKSQSGPV